MSSPWVTWSIQTSRTQAQTQHSFWASCSDSNMVSMLPLHTGPFTLQMMEWLVLSMNSTHTYGHRSWEPILPSTLVTMASMTHCTQHMAMRVVAVQRKAPQFCLDMYLHWLGRWPFPIPRGVNHENSQSPCQWLERGYSMWYNRGLLALNSSVLGGFWERWCSLIKRKAYAEMCFPCCSLCLQGTLENTADILWQWDSANRLKISKEKDGSTWFLRTATESWDQPTLEAAYICLEIMK